MTFLPLREISVSANLKQFWRLNGGRHETPKRRVFVRFDISFSLYYMKISNFLRLIAEALLPIRSVVFRSITE